jgi:DNA-binding LacI/PurR family transcriptional regulator
VTKKPTPSTAQSETPRRPVTAHDVARVAGVSQSAVSRAFTPGGRVAPATQKLIVAAAKKLGYRPNRIARSLITRRSGIVGVAMGYLENQFYPLALETLSRRLHAKGLQVLLFAADPGVNSDPGIEQVMQYNVDAIVLASTTLSSRLAADCKAVGVPVVLLNRTSSATGVSSVTGENATGGKTVAAFLAAGGHRRFAYMAGLENSSTSIGREKAYTQWLIANGFDKPLRAIGNYDFVTTMSATRELLARRGPRPDAIFCANDHTAIAVLEVARHEFGLRAPEDLSVVGFDDVGAARWPSFALTSYSQPIDAMVDSVVELIISLLDDTPSRPRHLQVPGELVVRQSARRPDSCITHGDGRVTWSISNK